MKSRTNKIKKKAISAFCAEWVRPADTEQGTKEQLLFELSLWERYARSDWEGIRRAMTAWQKEREERASLRIRLGFAEPWLEEATALIRGYAS